MSSINIATRRSSACPNQEILSNSSKFVKNTNDTKSSNDYAFCNTPQHNNPKRDMRKEMILYFYSSMLKSIIQTKEMTKNDSVPSIPSAEKIIISQAYTESEPTVIFEETEEADDATGINLTQKQISMIQLSGSHNLVKSEVITRKRRGSRLMRKRHDRASKHIKAKKSLLHVPPLVKKTVSTLPHDHWVLDHTEENVKIIFTNKNRYEGTTFCNMLHGQGKFTWSNGTSYEGEFKNNEITGIGRFQFPDQSIYTGEVYKNYCHGTGLLFPSTSPCIYKGNFFLNEKHGYGWQLFNKDSTYEGEWVDGQMSGEGYRKYPSGAVYYGKFIMGKRNGYGVAVFKNHDVYAGEWLHGERDGFGDYIWNVQNEHYFTVPVQSCYYGSWVDNKRDGIGVINFGMEGGSRYAGYFSNNEKHGSGIIICENGHVIESNPLFINDKPVHVTDIGDLNNLQSQNSSVELSTNEGEGSTSEELVSKSMSEDTTECTRQGRLLRRFPLDCKLQYNSPISAEEQSTVDICNSYKQNHFNSEIYNEVFPQLMDQYSSVNIPIGVSSELIDLNTHIYKIIEYKSSIQQSCKMKDMNEFEPYSTNFMTGSTSLETYTDYDLHKFEEKLIRKSISKYLNHLKRIYYLYAKIGCLESDTTFKPWLMRIFFWQLYRDCKIPEKGISLIEIDLMFSEKSTFDCYVVHNPFEVIYFWQYLESLLHVALALYGELFISSDDGVLKQSFEYLMENDFLPNAGHFIGSALFEYRDLIPVKAAYAWYKTFGEPHSVRDFYKNMFKLKNKKSPPRRTTEFHREILNLPYIQSGRNVINCGNKLFYFEDDNCFDPKKPYIEKIRTVKHENTNKLYLFTNLKPRIVGKIIVSICPSIKDNKDIINFDYKLSFLEFYEIILLCTQEKVKKEVHKMNYIKNTIAVTQYFKKKKKSTLLRKSKKAQG